MNEFICNLYALIVLVLVFVIPMSIFTWCCIKNRNNPDELKRIDKIMNDYMFLQ
jgi:hypothetical protein